MRRKLVIEETQGVYRIFTSDFEVRSTTLDGALAKARGRAGVPEDVQISSQFDAAEVLESLMGRKEGS